MVGELELLLGRVSAAESRDYIPDFFNTQINATMAMRHKLGALEILA